MATGTPSEIFYFGVEWYVCTLTYPIACVISATLFLPVFHRLGLTSVYEVQYKSLKKPVLPHASDSK